LAVESGYAERLFFLDGELGARDIERVVELLIDPVTEEFSVRREGESAVPPAKARTVEVHRRPGVMDPVAESTLAELRAEGVGVQAVRTAWRYVLFGEMTEAELRSAAGRVLANDCIEEVVIGTAGVKPAPQPPVFEFVLRRVPIRELDDAGLNELSRSGHLFLSREEMKAIQAHYRPLGRDPTDLELETLAQTWSEHCVHKTLKSEIVYRGEPLPGGAGASRAGVAFERRYENLLKDTIGRATAELMEAGRGPECLSVFKDNAGIIGFDEQHGVAFKVETHNHPSAIEPYGGAATGIGGVIRDVIGCGLGARPIANTDVFCVAPSNWPADKLPKGVLHPRRILRGIVKGVADYGNRMGIPTVNGAINFDPRYLGNPLVYCGCVGLIPRDKIEKAARPGDHIVLIGGRTGRDGIHGATFSSAELTDTHADEFSHAVQIGNAITEKRFLDAVLRARDDARGCLYSAITDCGAGGLSSAVGEMAEHVGATVHLDKVPLKYAGLRYDEIWISEAQERMVLAVPPEHLERFLEIMREEEVEASVIGVFGSEGYGGAPRLVVHYEGKIVGDLEMEFLHRGVPKRSAVVEWHPPQSQSEPSQSGPAPERGENSAGACDDLGRMLLRELARPDVAAKEWVIRQYDHEVQGGSVIKPLVGPGQGPGDAAVLRPVAGSRRGIALGCGLALELSDVDPYWMAAAGIDEAVRNVVAVGGDPRQTAVLDNFCWGRADDPQQLGGLVRACQACYDVAVAYGVPFISGKDSLNNEFALDAADVEPLLALLRGMSEGDDRDAVRLRGILPELEHRIRQTGRLAIPGTLLISAISIVSDVTRCVTSDLKASGNELFLVGGVPQVGFDPAEAAGIHVAVADAIAEGLVAACHDCSDGGWLTAVAEMAFAGGRGVGIADEALSPMRAQGASEGHAIRARSASQGQTTRSAGEGNPNTSPFAGMCAGYVIETADAGKLGAMMSRRGVRILDLGMVRRDDLLSVGGHSVPVSELRAAWAGSPACGTT